MCSIIKFVILIFYLIATSGHSQGAFHVGAKIGFGGSVIPLHSKLGFDGNVYRSYAGTTLSTGLITQYVIGKRIGFESGFHVNHYSFYYPDENNLWRRRFWKGAAAIELFDFQLPLAILYRIPLPKHPNRDITFVAGTSINWLGTDFLVGASQAMWLKNVYASVRSGKERMKGNRLEYGIEFQYAIDRYYLEGQNYNQEHMSISSRLSLLSINLYYFFLNKETHPIPGPSVGGEG